MAVSVVTKSLRLFAATDMRGRGSLRLGLSESRRKVVMPRADRREADFPAEWRRRVQLKRRSAQYSHRQLALRPFCDLSAADNRGTTVSP